MLSGLLWSELTGSNIVVQIYNNTPIISESENEIINIMMDNDINVLYSDNVKSSDNVCDIALNKALGRILFYNHDNFKDKIKEDDIIVITDNDLFISKGHSANVLQSDHKAWMFLSESIFYGHEPWTHPMAMTVATWR